MAASISRAGRALLLSGARHVGKTTLFLQAIDELLGQGYVIARELNDFRTQAIHGARLATLLLNIPAALACYWLGRSDHETANRGEA